MFVSQKDFVQVHGNRDFFVGKVAEPSSSRLTASTSSGRISPSGTFTSCPACDSPYQCSSRPEGRNTREDGDRFMCQILLRNTSRDTAACGFRQPISGAASAAQRLRSSVSPPRLCFVSAVSVLWV